MKTTGGLAATLATVVVTASPAQQSDAEPPVRALALTFSQELRAVENPGLSADSPGTTYRSSTRLGFSTQIQDEVTQMRLNTSTAVTWTDPATGSADTEISSPRLTLRYNRDGAATNLNARANYASEQIAFIRPLEDFLDDEGELVLPEDALDLDGTGRRTSLNANVAVTLRRDAPLSFTLSAGTSRRSYSGVSSAALFDATTDNLGARAQLRIDGATTASLAWAMSQYNADDASDTSRDRHSLSFGIDRAVSEVLSVNAGLGYSILKSTQDGDTVQQESTTGNLGVSLERPNGTIGLTFDTALTPTGTRVNYALTRSLSLPSARLNFSAGATRLSGGNGYDPTFSVSYAQNLPTSNLSVSLLRSTRFSDVTDSDRTTTSLSATYRFDITPVSSIGLRSAFSKREEERRTDLSVDYSHLLTQDWSLSTGYGYEKSTQNGSSADSHSIFVRIGRSFDMAF